MTDILGKIDSVMYFLEWLPEEIIEEKEGDQ